jgi:hypothetical protein
MKKHTYHKNKRWWLVADKDRFHVYVAVKIEDCCVIRIDWHDNSTFVMKEIDYIDDEHECFYVGRADFNKEFICKTVGKKLKDYNLFDFNCRKVAFLVLCIIGFCPKGVRTLFLESGMPCGIEKDWLGIDEMGHFMGYLVHENEKMCIIS